MIDGKRILGLITARVGSKRLPGKNIIDLAGKPLIAWTVEAALNSRYIDRVIVSTDDADISAVSSKYGAEVPFIRPPEISGDFATSIEVIRHALENLEKLEDCYEFVMLLQPTSPFRTSKDIDNAVELMVDKNADSIVGVAPINHPVEWVNTLPKNLSMKEFIEPKFSSMRSQDFSRKYRINGAIYLNRISILLKTNSLFSCGNSYAYVMTEETSIDIDNRLDFVVANALMVELNSQ